MLVSGTIIFSGTKIDQCSFLVAVLVIVPFFTAMKLLILGSRNASLSMFGLY